MNTKKKSRKYNFNRKSKNSENSKKIYNIKLDEKIEFNIQS